MDRLEWKQDLLYKLGRLFGPLQEVVDHPDRYNEQETARVVARYCHEYMHLNHEFGEFARGEEGHDYQVQCSRFQRALAAVKARLTDDIPLDKVLKEELPRARAALAQVPIPSSSAIYAARTPFSFYRALRGLCEVDATADLLWLDPYPDSTLFRRYLSAVPESVSITVVTQEPRPQAGRREQARWAEFLDISRLFAKERGSNAYRLVVCPSVHDRWIVFDKKRIYSLGGSAKDAAVKDCFTLTTVDGTEDNLRKIEAEVAAGVEWFGPSTPTHR